MRGLADWDHALPETRTADAAPAASSGAAAAGDHCGQSAPAESQGSEGQAGPVTPADFLEAAAHAGG